MTTYRTDNGEELYCLLTNVHAGDVIEIAMHCLTTDPAQPRPYIGAFSVDVPGLTIRGLEGAVFSTPWTLNADYMTMEHMHWRHFDAGPDIGLNRSEDHPIEGLRFRDCSWVHGASSVQLWYGVDVLFENCAWGDIRSRVPGLDAVAFALKRFGKNIRFVHCHAWDNGSDWIHIMPNAPLAGVAEDILIEDCEGWITRPYGSVPWHNFSSNVGENIIDVKGQYTSGVVIRRGRYGGIRPTVEGQDCSGESGCICRVHYGARDVRFENVHFYDAPIGTAVSHGSDGQGMTGNVRFLGCTYENVTEPIRNLENLSIYVDPNWTSPDPGIDLVDIRSRLVAIRAALTSIIDDLEE